MTRVSIPITEHVDDYHGDWQRALMGVVYATCPAAEVVGDRIFQNRGRPNLNVFLPDGVDAEAEAARIGAACDEHIKRSRRKAALGPGETAAKLPGAHAEVTALQGAAQAGAKPQALGVSRPICDGCKAAIEESGGTLTSPTTAVWE